jgi:hypothetical protein
MKVKDLIEKLQTFDQNQKVCFYVDERDCERDIGRVEEKDVEVRIENSGTPQQKSIYEKFVVLDK